MHRVINVKNDMPNVDWAVHLLDTEIIDSKALGNKIIYVIHGYGSNGVGGAIKEKFFNYYPELKKRKIITDYVFGENWSYNNEVVKYIIKFAPELIVDNSLNLRTSGVSVLLID